MKTLILLNIIMICILIYTLSCTPKGPPLGPPLDYCPSPHGYSCPLDGSPCPFCGGVK